MDSKVKQAALPKVLLIDSNLTNQKIVTDALYSAFDLKSVGAGITCLEDLFEFHPDVILLDVDLPNSESLKICRMIRAEPNFAYTPILFLSHMNVEGEQLKGFAAGGDDYLSKPINPEQLVNKLALSLDRAQQKLPVRAGAPYPALTLATRNLLDYMITLIELDHGARLGELMLATLDKLGLKGAIFWHSNGETHSSIGSLTDLETVLLQQATQSFPLDHSARFIWGSCHFGAIIHNMPSPRNEQYQTMRQLVTTLFKATHSKLDSRSGFVTTHLDEDSFASAKEAVDLGSLKLHCFQLEAALDNLENDSESHLRRISQTLQQLANDSHRSERDRQQFQKLLNQCIQTRIAIYDQCLALQTEYQQILGCIGAERETDYEPSTGSW